LSIGFCLAIPVSLFNVSRDRRLTRNEAQLQLEINEIMKKSITINMDEGFQDLQISEESIIEHIQSQIIIKKSVVNAIDKEELPPENKSMDSIEVTIKKIIRKALKRVRDKVMMNSLTIVFYNIITIYRMDIIDTFS
jgi:hypothetical protein